MLPFVKPHRITHISSSDMHRRILWCNSVEKSVHCAIDLVCTKQFTDEPQGHVPTRIPALEELSKPLKVTIHTRIAQLSHPSIPPSTFHARGFTHVRISIYVHTYTTQPIYGPRWNYKYLMLSVTRKCTLTEYKYRYLCLRYD